MTRSLYLRLSLAAIGVLASFLVATGVVLDNAFVASLKLSLKERMLGQIYLLLTVSAIDDNGQPNMPLPTYLPEPQLALPDSGLYAYIGINGNNQALWISPSLHKKPPPPLFSLQAGEQQWHELGMPDGKAYGLLGLGHQRVTRKGVHSLNFYLMSELTPLHEQILLYRQRLWAGLGVIGLLLLVTQLLLLSWALKPFRKVTLELEGIESGLQDSLVGSYPHEVHQLTDKINTLLSHERARQTRYRNALADLAHSLKTPLAVLRGACDTPESFSATVEEQSIRMTRIVERQLQRAATSADISTSTAIQMAPLIDRIGHSLGKVYRDKNVIFSNRVDPELRFRGDEADLMEILGNLLDNAFKWCRSRVIVGAQTDTLSLTVSIQDDGPGIAPAHVEKILHRGVRIDESTPGHGIGLAVTADIVEAYQGRIRIESSVLGGAAVILEFVR